MSILSISHHFHIFSSPKATPQSKIRVSPKSYFTLQASLSDPFVLQIAETLEDSLPPSSLSALSPLEKLRDASSQALISTSWPSRKDELFRFTDTSFIRSSEIRPISSPINSSKTHLGVSPSPPNLLLVDGHIQNSLSNLAELPDGVFIGSVSSLSSGAIMERVSQCMTSFEGDLFWSLNGVGTPDLILVYVPEKCRIKNPVHFKYLSIEGSDKGREILPISNPRVLVIVEEAGEIDMVEEFLSGECEKCYWANSVTEMVIGKGAKVRHSYVQNQSLNAAHIKWTLIQQESASTYEHVEVSTGGKLSRHNLNVQQRGPDTLTELSSFHLSLGNQTQDLHSTLILDHPRRQARHLHKCIVGHSLGRAVFDGNIKVNRFMQQTDAGQLTRCLILEPCAMINVKSNLQIIADDVKCSHGTKISDLEESQLFYFQCTGSGFGNI